MMPFNTLLIVPETDTVTDGNYRRIANILIEAGNTRVTLSHMDTLGLARSDVIAMGTSIDAPLVTDSPLPSTPRPVPLQSFDATWVLSLGNRHSFLDKIQLLNAAGEHTRIINSLTSLMHLKSKYLLNSNPSVFSHPETWASTDPDHLYDIVQSERGSFIVKPPALSMGRDVFLITPDDPNTKVILDTLTGPDHDQYCLLQRYIADIEQGEKRVLFAHGEPVGQYLRLPGPDHRTNIVQGASYEACDLTENERVLCRKIGAYLLVQGAEYVGMDLAYPWVIEFNVINPGGLLTIEELTGQDLTEDIVGPILAGC
ncbi:MAG: hypothetical protein CMQ05_14845 [Gammaproteobacteria bacterium]|uniref:ATP-grasp domain-containing protein n=1 Tax=OM182 bacterium MED-G24 TaxID=1986255 RepID=A0A2A5WHA8_9GAMM|nr:hypothetical protein [Gammaproteobacteria bacterium]PDH35859.1 MAG: hypothetical protein CNE99_10535 [OM182 bacterium MED-G24]RPG25488.1 MAG: hypothetical protein CBC10_007680 [Gammaproteobacteria bacterium TMED50]